MDQEDTLLIVGSALGVLAIIAVGARFYARRIKKAGYKWDDWLILVAVVAIFTTNVLAVYGLIQNPNGPDAATRANDTEDYSVADQEYKRVMWASTVVYFFTVSSTKMSFVLMYHRLCRVDQSLRRQIWILFVLIACFWIGCTSADLAHCIALGYTWLSSLSGPRYCFNYNHFWFAAGIVEATLDVLVILLPIKVILGLQLTRQQKLAIVFVFLLGALVIISGILKTAFGYIPGSPAPSFSNTQLWTTIHICTGIICACLPICWSLITPLARLQPLISSGATWIRRYWHNARSWSSRDKSFRSKPVSHGTETDEARVNHLTNNFTSRGFDVTFSGVKGESQDEVFPLASLNQLAPECAVSYHHAEERTQTV